MRSDGDRRGAEGRPVTRRVLLAAGGAVLLTSTATAVAVDVRAHSAATHSRPAADEAASRASVRASAPSRSGRARPAASPPARQHPELTRHAARPPPRHEQPRLPYGEPMYTLENEPKVVALTVDDGPSPVYTPQILLVLRRYGIIASFSMIGRNAAAFPGVAREVTAAGHMIVNHTWNHYNLGYMPAVAVGDEISQATDAIHAATGERPGMFRAPYGVWPPAVFSYCARGRADPAGLVGRPARLVAPRRPRDRPRHRGRHQGRLDHPGARRRRKPVADRGGAEDLAAPADRRGLPVHHPVSPGFASPARWSAWPPGRGRRGRCRRAQAVPGCREIELEQREGP
jgi:peptidoglycan/xylan/chitin deacetylase (PgdA/CDA1 family)